MNAGDLNQRITIKSQSASVDALGQPIDTWATVAEVWADVRTARGITAIKAGSEGAIDKVSFRIRWRTGLNSGMRVVHAGRNHNVLSVLPDYQDRQFVDLVCMVVE